ncbi:MAG TPA: DUF1844 domain-containing protein [Armatimonadetes bacterium]|jgi:hypothetical protein|nr:DUF1844 domain-containing protein [Armatimonadota bacterium]
MEEKQEEFEVVDRRRVNAEAEAPTEEPSPTEAKAANEEAPAEQAEQAAGEGQFPPEVDIYVLLSSMIGMLHGFAWQKMGFVADQKTGQVEEDLPQAKIAVDTVQYLAGKLEEKLSEAEVRELRRVVMDLQMNYLRKSSGGK